ncbi:MAG: hypothetical protein AMS14_09475 [Planctomycetes bacterium DG_20]|nr:MAG: hypothetical protein AMS14_09475 [Planctomycetes bacterium DG_20]
MCWLVLGIACAGLLGGLVILLLRGERCAVCRARRRREHGAYPKFCPECGHWVDPRVEGLVHAGPPDGDRETPPPGEQAGEGREG